MIDLTNQTVGDALSDVLLVETVLKAKGWSLSDWEKIYSDLPNRQLKVTIKVSIISFFRFKIECSCPTSLFNFLQ